MNKYPTFPNCMDVIINDSEGSEHLSAKVLHHRVRISFSYSTIFANAYPPDSVIHSVLEIFFSKLVACRRITYVCLCRGSKLSSKIFHLPIIRLQGTTKIWLFGLWINIIFVLSLRWGCRWHSPSAAIFRSSSRTERSNSCRECRNSFILLIRAPSIKRDDIQRCCCYYWCCGKGTVQSSYCVELCLSWYFGSDSFPFLVVWRVGVGSVVYLDNWEVQGLV